MNETRIPRISDETKERIRDIVKYHYGFTPKDDDIEGIDRMLRNNYAVLHEQRIIQELVDEDINKELLKHRDRIGSMEFERIWLEKTIFKYLTFASMCFRAGIPTGTVSLCRTAIESGLRERIAEELARKETKDSKKLSEVTWSKIEELAKDKKLKDLIQVADDKGIISKQEIEKIFQKFKFRNQSSRRILDKFIHGDIIWMVNFVRNREDIGVIGAKNKLEEYKIISDAKNNQIAIGVLKATYKIAEILYYKNI